MFAKNILGILADVPHRCVFNVNYQIVRNDHDFPCKNLRNYLTNQSIAINQLNSQPGCISVLWLDPFKHRCVT